MTRVDELQKKYPNVPREIIIKMEVLTLGIKDSEGLDKASFWSRAAEIGTYQSYDRHVDYAAAVAKRQQEKRPGFVKRLGAFYFKNGAGARMERDHTSPYDIKELSPGRFALFEGENKVEDIYYPSLPFPYQTGQEPVTSRGNPVTSVINMRSPYCFMMVPVRYCEYFNHGEQCKFCNFNHTQEQARSVGANRTATVNLDETAEAYKIVSSDVKFLEGAFLMGSFKDPDQTAKVQLDFIEKIGRSASYKVDIGAVIQPMTLKNMQRMKDCGVDRIYYSMEVWDRDLFGEVCPGKNKHTGYDRYLEAQLEAVDVFGAGRVTTAFVGGVTLMPPNGHKTWQEARDSMIEGFNWSIKNGIHPFIVNLRLGPGSVYGDDKTSITKLAPIEYYLDTSVAHHAACKEYGFYDKFYKWLWCPMDCLSHHYVGDLGMYEIGGNPVDWMGDLIPDEQNYLGHFIKSFRAPAQTSQGSALTFTEIERRFS